MQSETSSTSSSSLYVRQSSGLVREASVLDAIPAVNMLFIIWSVCAGFIAVLLYGRTTGQTLSIGNGARMGWITGILNSLIVVVLFTVSLMTSTAELTTSIREQVRTMAPNDANAISLVDSPYAIATIVIFTLIMMVVIFTEARTGSAHTSARLMTPAATTIRGMSRTMASQRRCHTGSSLGSVCQTNVP